MPTVTVSKKGWVVIPKEIRERHGIKPGDKIAVVDYGGSIALVPTKRLSLKDIQGIFAGGPSLTEALLEDRRLEREREERKFQYWAERDKEKERSS